MDMPQIAAGRVDVDLPSMEPRLFSYGYVITALQGVEDQQNLQWGHGFSAMDTTNPGS